MWRSLVLVLALSCVNAAPFYEVTSTDSTQDPIELSAPAADSSMQTFSKHESERVRTIEEGVADRENTTSVICQFSNATTTFEDDETTGNNVPKVATTNSAGNESEPLEATSTAIEDYDIPTTTFKDIEIVSIFTTTDSADTESEPLQASSTAIEDTQHITSSMRTTTSLTRIDELANPGTSTSTSTEEESPTPLSTPNQWRPPETATPEPTTIDTTPIAVPSTTPRTITITSPSTIPRTSNPSSEIDTTNIATSTLTTSAAEEYFPFQNYNLPNLDLRPTAEPAMSKEEFVTTSTTVSTANSSSYVPSSSSMTPSTRNKKEESGTDITRATSVPPSSLIHKGSDKSHRRAKEDRIKLALIGGGAASAALIAAVVIVLVLVWRRHNRKRMSGRTRQTAMRAKRADNSKNRKSAATSKPSTETRTLLGV